MSSGTRWAVWTAVPLLAIAVVSLAFVLRSTTKPKAQPASMSAPASTEAAATWPAGKRKAPAIDLRDERGRAVSLETLRGRPVLVTFIDPLCRDYCPTEAQHLSDAVRGARVKPTILAVSVNTAGNAPHNLALDRRKWGVVPQWTWAVGPSGRLARVWKRYGIEVVVTRKKVAGVELRRIAHTEAAYLIDAHGYERALFIWPYTAGAVTRALEALAQ